MFCVFVKNNDVMTTILWIAAVSTISAFFFLHHKKSNGKKNKYPPYAPASMMETIKALSGNALPSFMLRCADKVGYDAFRLALPISTTMTVVVGNVDTVREILTDPLTTKPKHLYKSFDKITMGPSLFSAAGKHDTLHSRKNIAPAFSSHHISRMNTVAMAKTEEWINKTLIPLMNTKQAFDVCHEMIDLTLSIVCEAAFEYDMHQVEKAIFQYELELALKEFTFKSTMNPLRPLLGFMLPKRRRAIVASQSLIKIAKNIIQNYKTLKTPTKNTMIDRIMTNENYKNDDERASDVLVLLLAGHDTTGYALAWTLLALAQNPSQHNKLQQELSSLPREEWHQSKTLQHVIKEAMRLNPVGAVGSIRTIGRDVTINNKKDDMMTVVLPKGSIVFLPQILLFRNPDIYDNPNTFDPSRWEKKSVPDDKASAAFLPFSLGRRNCAGQALAKAELHSVVARLVSEFDFIIEQEAKTEFFLTMKPAGAWLMAHKKKDRTTFSS